MEVRSLRLYDHRQPLSELFNIDGAIRNVIAISAYTDFETIEQLIEFVRTRKDYRTRPTLKIFIDRASSRFHSDRNIQSRFLNLNSAIAKICDDNSGIFLVQCGGLFHSKAYLIEGNKKGKVLFGSMNLTQKGINGNEEVVLFDHLNVSGRAKANKLAQWVKGYAMELNGSAVSVKNTTTNIFPSCIRQLLLEGLIYFEHKEQNPFRFKLFLPEKIAKQQAKVDRLLEASITDSISLEALLTAEKPLGLGMKLPVLRDTRSYWKKYCVETCYGYWNPTHMRKNLSSILKKRVKARRPYFEMVKATLEQQDSNVRTCFLSLVQRIKAYLTAAGIKAWKYTDAFEAEEAWGKWRENLLNKLNNMEYYQRVISGISPVPVPDVWNDPLSSEEFESSFCQSLLYYWSKEYVKETSNVVAKAFARNLGLDSARKEEFEAGELKEVIDAWLNENPDLDLSCFNEEEDLQ